MDSSIHTLPRCNLLICKRKNTFFGFWRQGIHSILYLFIYLFNKIKEIYTGKVRFDPVFYGYPVF